MTDYDKAVERRARALYDNTFRINLVGSIRPFESNPEFWLEMARATLEADDAAGYALVPKEATEAMEYAFAERYARAIQQGFNEDGARRVGVNAALAAGTIRKDEK